MQVHGPPPLTLPIRLASPNPNPNPYQLRLVMLNWYCAEGSAHLDDKPCQKLIFMRGSWCEGGSSTQEQPTCVAEFIYEGSGRT